MDRQEYLAAWKSLRPTVVTMTGKFGQCKHQVGETFLLMDPYDKPAGVCSALWHVLELYTWRVALGFPSWEPDDATVYRLHCPSKTGTLWEMRSRSQDGPEASGTKS